jgi:beta-1,4-mannosyl-glycoprotein beta-1,4-N-acetylglucosaminyltransferase
MLVDAVIFYDEHEMLEFRLKLLYAYVDKFVIVEGDKTHSGLDKPFFYEQNSSRYSWAADKIHYLKTYFDLDQLGFTKSSDRAYRNSCWRLENAQRTAIVDACAKFADSDLLVFGDVDEIPSLEALCWAKKNIRQLPVVCRQYFFWYNLCHLRQESWYGTIFSSLGNVRDSGIQTLRNQRNTLTSRISDGGWHLSYFGGTQAIIRKLQAFAHQELNKPEFMDPEYIGHCRLSGQDLFDRGIQVSKVTSDFFPPYFKKAVPAHWWQ